MYTEGVPHHKTLNNSNLHPIELALAIALSSIDSLLWIINELLGLHETAPAAPVTSQAAADQADYWNQYLVIARQETAPILAISRMTKRQLQAHTGIKSSKYNKAALQAIALGGDK